jgi:multiple sugar transport system substrate-binding protein
MSIGTLRLALAEGDAYAPLYDQLGEFTERSGHTVEVVTRLPLAELYAHVVEAVATGRGYDLICADSRYTAALAPLLQPLDDLLPDDDVAAFAAATLDLCRWEGSLYQLPRSIETRLLFYRSDIFDDRREQQWFAEASEGRELRVPQSWEDLAAVAQYFTRPGRMYGFAFPGTGIGLIATFAEILTTVGGTFFDSEGQPGFYSRAGEWTLTLLRDLYGRWEAVAPETADFQQEDVSDSFRMGRSAMICDSPGTARLLCDPTFSAVAGWHSVALLPGGAEGRRASWTGCPTFAIPRSCRNRDAAVALLGFLTSAESQVLEARHGAIPSRTDAYLQAEDLLRPGSLAHLRWTVAEQTLRKALLCAPALPAWPEVEAALWPLLQGAVTGELPVSTALEQARDAVAGVLASRA